MTSTIRTDVGAPSMVDTQIGSTIIGAIGAGADVHVIAPDARRQYAWAEPWLRSLSANAAAATHVLAEVSDLMDARTLILPPDAPVAPVLVLLDRIPGGEEWAEPMCLLRRIAAGGRPAGVMLIVLFALTGSPEAMTATATTAEWAERALELFGPGRETLP